VWIPPDDDSSNRDDLRLDKGAGSDGLILCEVPGLIAGAARGVGLGHACLKHIERCQVIVHLLDATSIDPIADYIMLNREVEQYASGQLASMPQVVVVNKIDVFEENASRNCWEKGLQVRWSRDQLEERLREVMPHTRLMWMSAKERHGVDDLMKRLASFVKKVKETKEDL
jgi:GTPase